MAGTVLAGRYRIGSMLGEGGMGAVFEGEHLLMHKRVAIKMLHPDVSQTGEMVQRFEREAMAAAHIDHPNVVTATDFGHTPEGACFLVLEYVEGQNLRQVMANCGALGARRSLHIAEQVASVLVKAHGLGIVHRDLKPDNVMLVERDGDADFVKVLDFGIAKVPVESLQGQQVATGQGLTRLGVMYGTPEYMAPEQAMGTGVDHRADLYALGIMLFEMLTGERPFDADNVVSLVTMHIVDAPPHLNARRPDITMPAGLDELVQQLLAKDREQRPASAREVIDRIRAILDENGVTPGPAVVVPSAPISRGSGNHPATVPGSVGSVGGDESVAVPPAASSQTKTPVLSDLPDNGEVAFAQTTAGGQAAIDVTSGGSLQTGPAPESRLQREMREFVPALEEMRRKLPGPLAQVPLVAYAGGLIVVLMVLTAVVLRPRTPVPTQLAGATPSATVAAPSRLTDAEIEAAARTGPSALEALADKYPKDERVLGAMVKQQHDGHHPAEAIKALDRLAKLRPEAASDEAMLPVIKAALEGPPEATDTAFAMLEEDMGEQGLSLLYALWTSSAKDASAKLKARAGKVLSKPEIKARASKGLQALIDLNMTPASCETKREGVELALEAGDRRAVPLLQRLSSRKGCGFLNVQDCWPCLRRDNALAEAIKAAEKRPEP